MARRIKFNPKQFFRDYPIIPIIMLVFVVGVMLGFALGQKTAPLKKIPVPRPSVERYAEAQSVPVHRTPPIVYEAGVEDEPFIPPKVETKVPEKSVFPFFPPKKSGPKLAIVIDDVGNNRTYADLLFTTEAPLTLAILPHLPYSKYFAEEGKKRGMETILHLPLEPDDEWYQVGKGEIKITMSDERIVDLLSENLASVPGVTGVNNHMGSRVTRNQRAMNLILTELKRRKLFFLDSMTHPNSVGYNTAKTLGLKTTKRDVFLDNVDEYKYIRTQLAEACAIAKNHGSAVAIGHVRQETLSAIRDALPSIKAQGIEVVNLKELL